MRNSAVGSRPVLLVVLLSLLVIALAGGNILVWRLFAFSVLVSFLSYLWARLGVRAIEGHVRRPSRYYQVGDSFIEESVISNLSLLPKPLVRVWENTDLPGHSNHLAINLPPRGPYSWQTRVYCRRRGRYYLGKLTAEVTDPFGLFPARRELGEGQGLLVYPAVVELPYFRLVPDIESGLERSYLPTTEPTAVVSRVREYIPGDSLNHIHWRCTAHTGKLVVKDFDLESYKNIWIVVDMSRGSLAGEGKDSTEEYSVSVAASLARKYLDGGRQVGLLAHGDDFYIYSPQAGQQQLWRIMESLAMAKASGDTPLRQLIDRETGRFHRDSIVVLVTSSLCRQLADSGIRLQVQGAMVVVIVVVASSFDSTVGEDESWRHLASAGVTPYLVARGDNLASSLDSRRRSAAGSRPVEVS